jgi:DNA-binding SARP family transcriptional activator/Tfp pilus assembly protein PilF
MLRLRTLGSLDLRGPAGEERLGTAAQPKRLALLVFLAVDGRGGFHRRDTLVALLWPDLDQAHARAALRKALHHLRRVLGRGVVITRGDEVQLDRTGLWCDARMVAELASAGDHTSAVELYTGEFLSGFHLGGAPDFELWMDAERHRLRATAARSALELAAGCRSAQRPLEAVRWVRRAIEIEPLEERPNRMLIELLAEAGDRRAALAAYDRFTQRLARELDVGPDRETRRIADGVRSQLADEQHQAVEPTPVLPVPDAADESAIERQSAHSIHRARTRRQRVVRGGAFSLAVAASAALGWGIVTAIRDSALSNAPPAVHRVAVRSADPDAYDSYVKGLYHSSRWPQPTTEQAAIREYEEAITKDPTFAAAHAGLAEVLLYTVGVSTEELERGKSAATRAVRLNPALPEAYVALGIARMREWDWSSSEKALTRAIALDPNSSLAHQWYAQLLRQMMRLDEAANEARRAAELDPLSLQVKTLTVGGVLFNQHRYDDAIQVWNSVLELDPGYGLAIYHKGLAYAMQGRGTEAIEAGERSAGPLAGGRYETATMWLRGLGYALSGKRDRAEAVLRLLETRHSSAPRAPGMIAALHHRLGREDAALQWLERGYQRRDPPLANITSEPWFDSLRSHPRFRALRAKIGLP